MTNPMFNPQPNYSGVTIQIANPAVNVGDCAKNCSCGNNIPQVYGGYIQQSSYPNATNPAISRYNGNQLPQNNYVSYPQGAALPNNISDSVQAPVPAENINGQPSGAEQYAVTNPAQGIPNSYPAQYYLNNYNYGPNGNGYDSVDSAANGINPYKQNSGYAVANKNMADAQDNNKYDYPVNVNAYRAYADKEGVVDNDLTRSQNIIGDIDERVEEERKEKKNTKETKIVALTDEYIKSLENYLNNPNDEIRLMASKEVLKRLDEDKDRYNDAALNALLNKMMQDPSKLVRLASLSAFSSQLASGNDYTVKLLHDIQSNPSADKEDVLQAADILLKMSAGVEIKNMPIPDKDKKKAKADKE